jgi:ATP-dependent Clp protease ATP-binding subunit ClpB
MIYEEMKKYSSEVSSSGITGGAANYIGYGDGTDLITRMKAIEDGGVLLLDEAEAAHKDIFNKTFNRAFQDGNMTNTTGKTTKLKNMVVVVTSNLGGHFTSKSTRAEIIDYFVREGVFPPDFLDRLDDIVVFDPIDTNFWGKLFDESIASFNTNILAKDLNYLRVSENARAKLLSTVEVGTTGSARDIKRTIKKLENEINNFMKHGVYETLDGRQIRHEGPLPGNGDLIELDWDDASGLIFKIAEDAN